MATLATLPGTRNEHRGLTHWMERVPKELDNLRKSPDERAVHDLRVAIRRCRSVATVLKEVDPDTTWRQMRHVPKKLFRKLGELRDTQIMDQWVTAHGAENDRIRALLHVFFEGKMPKLRDECLRFANKFNEREWSRLQRKLAKRVRLVPAGSPAAECLAVERFNEARELHAKALHAQRPESWHALRIGLKKLRYTAESLLPEKYEGWSDNLKRLQDLLGEVHDLDVLTVILKEKASSESEASQQEWARMIERERSERLDSYRELAVGKNNVWNQWRHALPQGKRLQAAAIARLRVTARATDAHPRRAAHISRLAIACFDSLGRAKSTALFTQHSIRRILRAAARLCGLGIKSGGSVQKAAHRFLKDLPVPPSWTPQEWALLAWTVRFHRGAEPKMKGGAFTRLPAEQQENVRALAGIIRLARGLRKCGVATSVGWRAEKSSDLVILRIPELPDTERTAARMAAAKHLLETYLGKPLILQTMPKAEKVVTLPAPAALPEQPHQFSAASD